ncbi:hypothetical protein ABZZ80_34895 [Streptomyces sp. NPDC006356]
MRSHNTTTREITPAEEQAGKSRKHLRWLAPALSLGLAPLILLASPGQASAQTWCFKSDGASYRPGGTTWAKSVTQANKTWQDWVWRGEAFKCNWNAPQSCPLSFQKTRTVGWKFSVGLKIDVKIPKVGKLFEVTPNYERNGSTTTSSTLTTYLKPGQVGQPISVVERRWTRGVYVGAFRTDGTSCGSGKQRFWWDGNYQFGKWEANLRVNDYGTFHVH